MSTHIDEEAFSPSQNTRFSVFEAVHKRWNRGIDGCFRLAAASQASMSAYVYKWSVHILCSHSCASRSKYSLGLNKLVEKTETYVHNSRNISRIPEPYVAISPIVNVNQQLSCLKLCALDRCRSFDSDFCVFRSHHFQANIYRRTSVRLVSRDSHGPLHSTKNKFSLPAGGVGSWYAVAGMHLYRKLIVILYQTFHDVLDP